MSSTDRANALLDEERPEGGEASEDSAIDDAQWRRIVRALAVVIDELEQSQPIAPPWRELDR
jgi:hypothetical protein